MAELKLDHDTFLTISNWIGPTVCALCPGLLTMELVFQSEFLGGKAFTLTGFVLYLSCVIGISAIFVWIASIQAIRSLDSKFIVQIAEPFRFTLLGPAVLLIVCMSIALNWVVASESFMATLKVASLGLLPIETAHAKQLNFFICLIATIRISADMCQGYYRWYENNVLKTLGEGVRLSNENISRDTFVAQQRLVRNGPIGIGDLVRLIGHYEIVLVVESFELRAGLEPNPIPMASCVWMLPGKVAGSVQIFRDTFPVRGLVLSC